MKKFSYQQRSENFQNLDKEFYDLVIIGGGINGAGAARDAAMRGMKVALLEAQDFAAGTSSRSSKLIHGGIRYLENMEFHLVFEALSERARLFEMAPHLVHPLRFMIPLYKTGRVGMFKMGLGMWLYDALSLFQTPELHERLSPQESLQRHPILQGDQLLGSYVYSDAYMDDDRLVLETLRSAHQYGAHCINFAKVTGAQLDKNNQVTAVQVTDQKSSQKKTIRGKHFISTVGPWTDILAGSFFKDWKNILRPTKGVHLTFEKKRLPLTSAVVMAAEKRIVFAIPRHEMVIVGTTDTDFKENPDQVVATSEDVKYLLGVLDKYFPGAKIKETDIVGTYAGVRPLVKDEAESEGKTSREHSIFTDPHGVTFVAGGKYTTYRLISQQVVEHCLQFFSVEERIQYNQCHTHQPLNSEVALQSGVSQTDLVSWVQGQTKWPLTQAQLLADRHGGEARSILQRYGNHYSYWQIEALHAIDNTMCVNLVDFYTRRVPLFLAKKDHGLELVDELTPIFSQRLDWSESETKKQIQQLHEHIQSELVWRNESHSG